MDILLPKAFLAPPHAPQRTSTLGEVNFYEHQHHRRKNETYERMHDERKNLHVPPGCSQLMCSQGTHPLLQQTPLRVSPFIDLPKPPTLPPNYTSLPSTLPPSTLNSAPTSSAPDLPAYVVSNQGGYTAHPSTIAAQNKALLKRIEEQADEGRKKVEEWEESIRARELAERRRKAPGWLDSEARLLEPEKAGESKGEAPRNIMDEEERVPIAIDAEKAANNKQVDDLGQALDRAFGRSEMG